MEFEGAAAIAAATAAAEEAASDKTAPLAVALAHKGLSEQQLVQDGWTALLSSLPSDAVKIIMKEMNKDRGTRDDGRPSDDDIAALDRCARQESAAILGVLGVTPSSALSCELWCRGVARFAIGPIGRELLGTEAVRDAFVALGPQATTADACRWWCTAICHLTLLDANQKLFGTAAVRDALVALSAHATTAGACCWWCSVIVHLTANNDANKQLLGTPAVRDALVALRSQTTTPTALEW
jgi:hypothetical protein